MRLWAVAEYQKLGDRVEVRHRISGPGAASYSRILCTGAFLPV